MKLTEKEKKAVTMLRELHSRQRVEILDRMQREILANQITERVTGRKLRIVEDKKIERAFGAVPIWRSDKRGRKP